MKKYILAAALLTGIIVSCKKAIDIRESPPNYSLQFKVSTDESIDKFAIVDVTNSTSKTLDIIYPNKTGEYSDDLRLEEGNRQLQIQVFKTNGGIEYSQIISK
jgi:hypothetical protein